MNRMEEKLVCGVDLGTTNSCIAAWKNGKAVVVPSCIGTNTIPSCVEFTECGIIIGSIAEGKKNANHSNTIFDIKRIIGKKYDSVKEGLKNSPFAVVPDENGKPQCNVEMEGESKLFYPEEVSAIVLKELKEEASRQLGEDVEDIVLTIPAYFNDTQREATKIAAKIAGLNVLKMIPEPVAAALAFGFSPAYTHNEANVLVYDLGGGTFDVAIVSLDVMGMYHVRSTNGNTLLGGAKFVDRLVHHCLSKLKDTTEVSIDELYALRSKCESAIISLSTIEKTDIAVCGEIICIDRSEYNNIIKPYVEKTMACVENAIADSDLEKDEINEVILVGGATYTPLVRSTLEKFFNKNVNTTVHPMEAVALGACVQAAVIVGKSDAPPVYVRNVTPLTIGLIDAKNEKLMCKPLINRNTSYPIAKKVYGKTNRDAQTKVKIIIYEGEHQKKEDNLILGSMILDGIMASAKGNEIIEVTVKIDDDGKISAVAVDQRTKNQKEIHIERPDLYTAEKVAEMISSHKQMRKIEQKDLAKVEFNETLAPSKRTKFGKHHGQLDIMDDPCPVYGFRKVDEESSEESNDLELGIE